MVVLEKALESGPDAPAFRRLAMDDPHKWAQTVKILAGLSGFADKREVKSDIYTFIHNLTDAQLDDAINQIESGQIIDVTDYTLVD